MTRIEWSADVQACRRAALANPGSDVPKGVLADALDDSGYPELGHLLRLRIALQRGDYRADPKAWEAARRDEISDSRRAGMDDPLPELRARYVGRYQRFMRTEITREMIYTDGWDELRQAFGMPAIRNPQPHAGNLRIDQMVDFTVPVSEGYLYEVGMILDDVLGLWRINRQEMQVVWMQKVQITDIDRREPPADRFSVTARALSFGASRESGIEELGQVPHNYASIECAQLDGLTR